MRRTFRAAGLLRWALAPPLTPPLLLLGVRSLHGAAPRLAEKPAAEKAAAAEKPAAAAKVLVGGRDPRDIIEECNAVLSVKPKEPLALINKAIALHSLSRWMEALAVASVAQEVAPADSQATLHLLRAECLFQTGKPKEALEEADAAVTKGATGGGLAGLRAHCLYVLNQDDEALDAVQAACKEQPENGQLHYLRGKLLHEAGSVQDALGALNKASRLSPNDAAVHLERARVLRGLADRDAAKSALKRSLELNPDSPFAHNLLGITLSEDGDLEGALASWERALALDPADPSLISNKGKCLHRLGRYEAAVAVFQAALESGAAAEGFGVHASLGECLAQLGRHEEATAALEEATRQQPDDGLVHALAAFSLRALGRVDLALQAMERACELEPDRANFHALRGSLLQALGRSDDSIAALERSLQLDCRTADAADVYYARGMVRGARGDVAHAVADFDAALLLNERHLLANTKKALWFEEQGRSEEALKIWDKLIEFGQSDGKTLTYRGKTLARLSRTDEAREAFRAAAGKGEPTAEPHKALGALEWGLGNRREAYEAWSAGSAVDPLDVICHFLQGVYLSQAGEPEEALAALDRALRATADPPPEVLELRNEVAATLLAMDRERAAEGAEAA